MLRLPHNCSHLTHKQSNLKILQARLQWYMNYELPDIQAGFRKVEEPEIKLPTSAGSSKSKRVLEKHLISALLTMPKPLTMWITTNCGKLTEMGIPDHLTCILRNMYVGQEATFRTRHGTTDWFQIGKIVHQGCILSSCLFNLHVEYIM